MVDGKWKMERARVQRDSFPSSIFHLPFSFVIALHTPLHRPACSRAAFAGGFTPAAPVHLVHDRLNERLVHVGRLAESEGVLDPAARGNQLIFETEDRAAYPTVGSGNRQFV